MIFNDLLTQANLHAGRAISAPLGIRYINEGIMTLAREFDTARKRATATITAEQYVWQDLPAGCLNIIECTVEGFNFTDYTVSYGQIQFAYNVTANIVYLVSPSLITEATGTPDVHEMYHYPLSLFMAARERQRIFGDEEQDAVRLMSEFLGQAASANALLKSMRKDRKTVRVSRLV